jgi:hypothetical protein
MSKSFLTSLSGPTESAVQGDPRVKVAMGVPEMDNSPKWLK